MQNDSFGNLGQLTNMIRLENAIHATTEIYKCGR